MSLTKEGWAQMWDSIKEIEYITLSKLKSPPTKQAILWEVKKIKDQIQSVVGQME